MTRRARCSAYFLCFSIFAVAVRAQITSVAGDQAQPIPGAGHDYIHMLAETVNPADGALSVRITVPNPRGRGISVPFAFGYDSNAEHHFPAPQFSTAADNPGYLSKGGWAYLVPQLNLVQKDNYWYTSSPRQKYDCYYFTDYMLTALDGQIHPLNISAAEPLSEPNCVSIGYPPITGVRPTAYAAGSYERFQATTPGDPGTTGNPTAVTAADIDGTVYHFSHFQFIVTSQGGFSSLPSSIEDRNGNIITFNDNGNGNFSVTDTLGRPLLSSSGFGTTGNTVTISGITNPYTVTWGSSSSNWSYNTQTTYDGGSGVCAALPGTYQVTLPEITAIQLPNGSSYSFQYDATSGLLNKLIYPTGAYVRYVWGSYPMSDYLTYNDSNNTLDTCHMKHDTQAVTDRYVSFDGVTEVLHQHFSYATPTWVPDNITPTSQKWTQKTTTVTTYDLVNGTNFNTVFTYVPGTAFHAPNDAIVYTNNSIPVENTISRYSTSGSLLQTVTETFVGGIDLPPDVETNDKGQVSQTTHVYDSSDRVLDDQYEYDFGSGSPGPLLKHTHIDYFAFQPTPIFTSAPSILDRPSDVIVYNGSGSRVAETDYDYDQTAPGSVYPTPIQHDETYYTSGSSAPRGNATTVTMKCFAGSTNCTNAVTTYTYDTTGQVLSVTDPCGNAMCSDLSGSNHTTTYSYADQYVNGTPPGNTNSYVTKITDAANHVTQFKWGYEDGNMWYMTDENNQTTQYCYVTGGCGGSSFDPFFRLTGIAYPSGTGKEKITYSDAGPEPSMTESEQQAGSVWLLTTTTYDGMGHVIEVEDPTSAKVSTTYDGLGRPEAVTNPYYSSTDPLYGTTTYTYDSLGRKTTQVQPDGSKLQWCYNDTADQGQTNCISHIGSVTSGEWVDFTDETGNHWQRTTDSFGRLTDVIEDASNSKLETDYAYDALNDLLRADQWGGAHGGTGDRIRTFTYDSLSRLLCASNSENSTAQCPATATTSYTTGTIGYTYDANGNVSTKISLLPNQTGSATLTTTNTYDELNRVTAVSYSDGITPGTFYAYDVAPSWSPNLQNVVGHLAYSGNSYAGGTSGYATETTYSYDPRGRILQEWEQTPSLSPNGDTVSSTYDLAGHMIMTTTAAGTLLTYNQDHNGRVSTITSSLNDAQHPGTLYSVDPTSGYYSNGAIHKATFGNGLTETEAFNDRLQPCRMNINSSSSYYSHCADASPSGTVLDFSMGYNAGSTDNGNVVSWSATGQQVFSRTYQYDHLNRISSMADSASGQSCKGLSWVVDPWGNLTSQTTTGGTCYSFSTSSPGTNNRLTAYSYDAAGNVIYDGTHHYTYDALGRVLSVDNGSTASYVYNENGQRVRKNTSSGWTEYFYGIDGNVQSEWNGSSWPNQYVYDGSRLLAIYTNGTTEFIHPDYLGSTRLMTGISQNIIDNMDYEPFGQQQAGNSATTHKFTGKERDSESGNDYFGARYYASTMGRWLSPDDPILYQDNEDPQSWNLYGYVRNNPLNRVDPNGHLTVIIPGTGYSPNDWNQNMKLVQEAKQEFHDPDVQILNWNSALGGGHIEAGAQQLINMVNDHSFAPDEQLNIIGHSRGGDVAIDAAGRLNHKVDNLITLSTPSYGSLPDFLPNVGNWINVTVAQDWVQLLDSTTNFDPRTFSGAHNFELNAYGYNHIAAHSAVWQNDSLRRLWWQYWLEHAGCQQYFDPQTNTVHGCQD